MEHKRHTLSPAPGFWKVEAFDESQREPADGSYWIHNRRRPEPWVDLHIVFAGKMIYADSLGQHEVPPGYALMFAHGENTAYGVPAELEQPLHTAWISFSGEGMRQHWAALRARHGSIFRMGPDSPPRWAWRRLTRYLNRTSPAEVATASRAVHGFVMHLFEYLEDQASARKSPVERAIAEVVDHPTHPWSLKEVSARHGCTREHFARVFRKQMGVTPATYLNQLKLAKALQLLTDTALPLRTVAAQAGFGSRHSFARWVRTETGRSPSAIRAEAQGAD